MCNLNARNREGFCLRGFTFIEILFVVLVMGIMMAGAVPQFKKSLFSFRSETFSRGLQSTFHALRLRSIKAGEVISLKLDSSVRVYQAVSSDSGEILDSYPVPEGIEVQMDRPQVNFYPDGRIDKVTVTISGSGAKDIILTTQGVYGSVKLQTRS